MKRNGQGQIKTCRRKEHVKTDGMKGMPNLFCGIFAVGGNYNLTRDNLMLMKRGWSFYGDKLRDDMMENHPEINIVDFELYNVEAFNRCENNNEALLAFKSWESVHPLIRIIPVEWNYTMPFGILHSKTPSDKVKRLIKAINEVK